MLLGVGFLIRSFSVNCFFGLVGIVWGGLIPSVAVLQMIHYIESVSHSVGGYRRFPVTDNSRNHWLFGVVSFGEGYHHNHHCFPHSARIGPVWWEVDLGYAMIRLLSAACLVWNVRTASSHDRLRPQREARERVLIVRRKADWLLSELGALLDGLREPVRSGLLGRCAKKVAAFTESLEALMVAGQASVYDATQGLQQALCDDVSGTPTVADQAADRIRAFTTYALDALGHPNPKPVPAHSEEFGNAR
jgi:hypothetical protein